MKPFFIFYFLILLSVPRFVTAQDETWKHVQAGYSINIKKATGDIKIDGMLNEKDWMIADPADSFWMKFPNNISRGRLNTVVQTSYDDKFLYIGFTCFDSTEKYIVRSLKRDQGIRESDGLGIVIDPINEKSNGFYFSLSPYNTQSEALTSVGTEDLPYSWDNKWYSETKVYKDRWVGEIAIPFSILRYDASKSKWGINFIRSDRKSNEFYTWTHMPLQFRGFDIGYLGQLVWDAPPPKAGRNISINPYITSGISKNNEDNEATKATFNAGFDAKVAVTPSMNLDLTVNPDFSQVDVDRQVTNLTRFDIFFPERRVFFLENDDLFSSYGIPPIRPFYSRRIGSKNGQSVPILFGARLSGNLNKNLRVGLMNIQTGRKADAPADNYTVISANQRVLSRSLVKGYFINRQGLLTTDEKIKDPLNQFGRNAGVELNFTNKDGTWQGWYGHHLSWKPGIKGDNQYLNGGGGYFGRNLTSFIDGDIVGTNYYADAGFVNRVENRDDLLDTTIRLGYKWIYNENLYTIYTDESKTLNRIEFGINNFQVWTPDGKFNERTHEFGAEVSFKNSSSIELNAEINNLNLLFPTKFTSDELAPPIPVGNYKYSQLGFEYTSDQRKNFGYSAGFSFGKFYTADYRQVTGSIIFRSQPKMNFILEVEYNKLSFPIPYGSDSYWLIAPQLEINFSNNLFWTSFLQYNSQANNFNINSRLQWRYKPMCDFFLVYTDNYFTDPFMRNKNRAIVFKINYWLNK